MDRHRFYAEPDPNTTSHFDADPDPTFHFDADQDPNPDPSPSFTLVGKSDFCFTFISTAVSLHIVLSFSSGVIVCSNFQNFKQYIENLYKKYSLLFYLVVYGSGSGSAGP
jgi:hypothetical protein